MDIVKLCLDMGATKAEEIEVSKLVLMPELREFCVQNACGMYGQNHTCPPLVGDIEKLISDLGKYEKAVIWQNIYPLEDSFDFEGMMDGKLKHDVMTYKIAEILQEDGGFNDMLILGAGGCTLCDTCGAKSSQPCLNPKKALSSLEAYGINVSKIEDITDMKYINGVNTVSYFSGAFYN